MSDDDSHEVKWRSRFIVCDSAPAAAFSLPFDGTDEEAEAAIIAGATQVATMSSPTLVEQLNAAAKLVAESRGAPTIDYRSHAEWQRCAWRDVWRKWGGR